VNATSLVLRILLTCWFVFGSLATTINMGGQKTKVEMGCLTLLTNALVILAVWLI
jgi:hypothetical protein